MAINFSALPTESPNALPPADIYYVEILEADMKSPKDETKPDYLNLKLQLIDAKGIKKGIIYDILSESETPAIQYKISRFLRACGIPLIGEMELKDLAKIVKGKKLVADITIQAGKDGYQDKAAVNIFGREAYYKVDEFAEIYALVHASDDVEIPQTPACVESATDGAATISPAEY